MREKMMFDDEALYSVTNCRDADRMSSRLVRLKGVTSKSVITDMTACVGGNVMSFARGAFEKVNAVELDAGRFEMLKHNLAVVQATNVECLNGNSVDLVLKGKTKQDVLFIDAPWGGPEYTQRATMPLFLKDGDGVQHDLGDLVPRLLDYAKYVALKVPVNFDLKKFRADLGKNMEATEHIDFRKMMMVIVKKK
jgi:predicted RNA methylase